MSRQLQKPGKLIAPKLSLGYQHADDTGLLENMPMIAEEEDNRRGGPRRSVLWPARLLVGRHEFACQIFNLSLGGARIRIDLPLKEGSLVALKAPSRRALEAYVAWSAGDNLGLQFADDPATIKSHFADRMHILGLNEDI